MTSETDASDTSAAGTPPPPPPASQSATMDKIPQSKKRSDSTASATEPSAKKRRAARACVSCRARKVRCNVVDESPCANCRFDNVECHVQESRRRKKHLLTPPVSQQTSNSSSSSGPPHLRCKSAARPSTQHPVPIHSAAELRRPSSGSAISSDVDLLASSQETSSNLLYQRAGYRSIQSAAQVETPQSQTPQWPNPPPTPLNANPATNQPISNLTAQFLNSLEEPDLASQLPAFIRPLPTRIAAEDVSYLHIKGALTLPSVGLQNALLQSYVEYVHPYMPLMDLHDFLDIVNQRDGINGQTSLFLYHAVMFSASAFVDMKYLKEAGYTTRKAARKSFFQKTRLLYDFDYEMDRLVLVQALLLMSYWYETPDDQKDTWHWMGVAISLAHTIGLHRNPGATTMSIRKQKLWKRIWWSCFMRDRLIALGMRRPTRIKDEDFDVPMLEESDFEIQPLADNVTVIPASCTLMRDTSMQRELAAMCIAKAELCVCISHMLKAQYSVLIRDKTKPDNTTNSTMMLFPNKQLDNVESVQVVDMELMAWAESLPQSCQYRTLTPLDIEGGKSTLAVQRTLLHMVYYTTISALHRPQFLPSSPTHAPTTSRQAQEMSRVRVRDAANHITFMAASLHQLRLEKYLPTTGVTVVLPAMIIHLLEMKNVDQEAAQRATRGFKQCMKVMEKLREIYAAADYATGFLDAAVRKAAIDVQSQNAAAATNTTVHMTTNKAPADFSAQTPPPDNAPYMTASESLFNDQRHMSVSSVEQLRKAMAPPATVNTADLDLTPPFNGHSPPHTDFGDGNGPTPSASDPEVEMMDLDLDLDFMQGHDEFDWNAVAGTDFDVDQWLQFPAAESTAAAPVAVDGPMVI
ncbi:fungal-specific transcription factor domain-containing protein [Emericellopsis atlantica]|uniref:Fungal-specific transcription factor domain-containing protein n=1 Tax=Emericellopsis atlantica TaxID=2614577 RepID=A0A9P7ZNH5_9HYPO|nr:fungal-specific transcription factor domain-containing protein [Emericellopsis atlantica]KAG9255364.1 fungal-specific transcription factor domain-containing protein [Emericellopsis atlantica]